MKKFIGFLRLMRLANVITAISDVLAGVAIAGTLLSVLFDANSTLGRLLVLGTGGEVVLVILLLSLSTACLYGGGVVLNDVFDARLDKRERPERPIPSGLISRQAAAAFGILLLAGGILAAALAHPKQLLSQSTFIALSIAIASVVYDKWAKHSSFFGPLNMGICRGLNLLLGMSVVAFSIQFFWYLSIVPVIYIAAITMISRGEVHGGNKKSLRMAAFLYGLVIVIIGVLAYLNNSLTKTLPLLALFGLIIYTPLQSAIAKPEGARIGKAVKTGVIALILMNAAWSAAFGDLIMAAIICLLLPVSYLLSKAFAVT